jgi:hypothetical protein
MKVSAIIIFITFFHYFVIGKPNDEKNVINIEDHMFLFISGWPQSGTSLLNQIMTVTPTVSTMIKKCLAIKGRKCVSFNGEVYSVNNNMLNISINHAYYILGTVVTFKYVLKLWKIYHKTWIINHLGNPKAGKRAWNEMHKLYQPGKMCPLLSQDLPEPFTNEAKDFFLSNVRYYHQSNICML